MSKAKLKSLPFKHSMIPPPTIYLLLASGRLISSYLFLKPAEHSPCLCTVHDPHSCCLEHYFLRKRHFSMKTFSTTCYYTPTFLNYFVFFFYSTYLSLYILKLTYLFAKVECSSIKTEFILFKMYHQLQIKFSVHSICSNNYQINN